MNHYELIERARNGEVIGNGAAQITALLDCIDALHERNKRVERYRTEAFRAQHLWEGKHAILRHENNQLRRNCHRLKKAADGSG